MKKLGFIGIGKMGYAFMRGALKKFKCDELIFADEFAVNASQISRDTGVLRAHTNKEVAESAKYIVLAVKPQVYADVLEDIKEVVTERHVIFSIAPGKTISYVKDAVGGKPRIVRLMPNTAAQIGLAATGAAYTADEFSSEELNVIDTLLTSIGKYEVVDENLMNAVVCASGSSPAYVYEFIIALCDAVEGYGLPHEVALNLITQTITGAVKMMEITGIRPEVLKENICSKGGTTLAALEELNKLGFSDSIKGASDACLKRSIELAD